MIPGNTDLSSYNKSTVSLTKLDVFDKKAIILATNDVNDVSRAFKLAKQDEQSKKINDDMMRQFKTLSYT